MKDVNKVINDPGLINDFNHLDYDEKDYRKQLAHKLNSRLSLINKNKISSKVFLILGTVFAIAFYFFVLSPGSIIDFILSGIIIGSLYLMSYLDYNKAKTRTIIFKEDRNVLMVLIESPEEKISRIRLNKLEVILDEDEEIVK